MVVVLIHVRKEHLLLGIYRFYPMGASKIGNTVKLMSTARTPSICRQSFVLPFRTIALTDETVHQVWASVEIFPTLTPFPAELVHDFRQGLDSQGWSQFMPKRMLQNWKLGYLEDGWMTLTAHMSIYDSLCPMPLLSNESLGISSPLEETPKCVVCLDKEPTAGFVHGKT